MLNTIIIMGRLVRAPEVRRTNSGKTCASFTVAVDRDYGDKQADFLDCVAWQQTGDFVDKYFMKGDPIVVQGRMQSRDWTDKQGGKRRAWEIVVSQVHFAAGGKRNAEGSAVSVDAGGGEYDALLDDDPNLPF